MANGNRTVDSWTADTWKVIDDAVFNEAKRTKVVAQFLTPPYMADPNDPDVPSEAVDIDSDGLLTVDQNDKTVIVGIAVHFALQPQQVAKESKDWTACTLATRAANLLSRAEDLMIFQGKTALKDPVFSQTITVFDGLKQFSDKSEGLLAVAQEQGQVIEVHPLEPKDDPNHNQYGDNTFAAVAQGYSLLQSTHYGSCALILPTNAFADTLAPLNAIMPADRIKGIVGTRFYGSSALPNGFSGSSSPNPQGLLLALDGNTMDLVMSTSGIITETEPDGSHDGLIHFRVYQRFAFRLKDKLAVVSLKFLEK